MNQKKTQLERPNAPAESGDAMFYRIKGLVRACELAGLTAGPLFTLFGWQWYYHDSGRMVQVTAHHIKEYFQEVIAQILEAGRSEAEVRSEMITYNAIGGGNLVVERHQSADGEDVWRLSIEVASFSRSKRGCSRRGRLPKLFSLKASSIRS